MWSPAGLERTRRHFDAWNPAGLPVDKVKAVVADLDARRPPGRRPLDVYHRAFAQMPLRPASSGDVVARLAVEAAQARDAGFTEIVLEHNFWDGIRSPDDWAEVPDRFAPVLEAAGGS
jgi:hypothetical protein